MYPAYIEVASFQGEKGPERSFRWALKAKIINAQLYREARNYVGVNKIGLLR
ncbi:MAG: hypothetical protein QXY49_01310 [Thermofilaceae archaeon]